MKREFQLARYDDQKLPSSELHTVHPSSAVKIDEKQELMKRAKELLPMFRRMCYAERREYAKYNIDLYVLLVDLEQQTQTALPSESIGLNDRPRFEKITDARTGETKYYYKRN